MAAICNLEDRISDVVQQAMEQLLAATKSNEVVDLKLLMAAVTTDIITKYSFGQAMGLMHDPVANNRWAVMGDVAITQNNFARFFPLLMKLMINMPLSWLAVLNPDFTSFAEWYHTLMAQVKAVKARLDAPSSDKQDQSTVIDELFLSSLPPEEKSIDRIRDEAQLLVGAGAETTATVLNRTLVHLLNTPEHLARLQQELDKAIPDPNNIPNFTSLMQLPYLSAVIEEGLRLSFPVVARGPRVFEDHTFQYKQWAIPPGTPIGQSMYFVLKDPEIFPEPMKFIPERWIGKPELKTYQVAFSKGRRACLGLNLAYAELFLVTAPIIRKFDMELFNCSIGTSRLLEIISWGFPNRVLGEQRL